MCVCLLGRGRGGGGDDLLCTAEKKGLYFLLVLSYEQTFRHQLAYIISENEPIVLLRQTADFTFFGICSSQWFVLWVSQA